jgi:P-type Ca2+ transporter type 2C
MTSNRAGHALDAPHALEASAVCDALGVEPDRGLGDPEAEARLAREGPNVLPDAPPPGLISLVVRQFRDALVLLLVGAALLSFGLGDWLDGVVIAAILVVNAALGAIQEGRGEGAARAVRSLLAPTARVVCHGRVKQIDAALLVPGEVVVLAAGDRVPADGRLIAGHRLEIDESLLTGEALPVPKRASPPADTGAPLAERATMAWSGTTVTRGHARIVLTATGTSTEVGRIAAAASGPAPIAPLQRRLQRLARTLLRAGVAICVVLALLSYGYGDSLADSLLVGASLAVAAVPEGLAAVITVTLAIGMRRLAEHGAIVRRLSAVETLGSSTVICTDKTGTLTTNRMRVSALWALSPDGDGRLLAAALAAADDAGEPMEEAIAQAARQRGIERPAGRVVAVEPFDSERKRVCVVLESADGDRTGYVKGAPEAIAPRVAQARDAGRLERTARDWAADGTRVLMVAERARLAAGDNPEQSLRALGLIGLADPLRPSARGSVELARSAGIRTIMITGDHPRTAAAIAVACGIAEHAPPTVLTGSELDRLSDSELRERADQVHVFARVLPEHKVRLVTALQARGEVVAMTGDGVNDAPALRAADIGVAMGRGGSDAAIDAADLVLTDNDFSTIVLAIAGGRRIYRNILRFLHFLLAANTGEVLTFVLAIALGLGAPLTITQILLMNLLTDGLPALALGGDPAGDEVMRVPPRRLQQNPLASIWRGVLLGGAATGSAAFAAYVIGQDSSQPEAQTMAFTTLVFAQLAYVYTVRGTAVFLRVARNRELNIAVGLSAIVTALVLAVPALRDVFDTVALHIWQLALCGGLAMVPLTVAELAKLLGRRRHALADARR